MFLKVFLRRIRLDQVQDSKTSLKDSPVIAAEGAMKALGIVIGIWIKLHFYLALQEVVVSFPTQFISLVIPDPAPIGKKAGMGECQKASAAWL
jgi:hypothetical protein